MNTKSRISSYGAAVERFDQWVAKNRGADGAWRKPSSADGYFSFANYAAEVGRNDWALAALRHVQGQFMSGGRLQQGRDRDQMVAYVPAWLAMAAFRVGMFEMSTPLLDEICSLQCRDCRGFFASVRGRNMRDGPIDFDSTAMSTIALAHCGRGEAAVRGADFLMQVYESQPAMEKAFYTGWRQPGGLLHGQAAPPETVLWWAIPSQHYYKIGLFTLALASAYGVGGERRHLETAVRLHDHAVERAKDLWTNTVSHKMCWAASALFTITGEARFLDHACRFADHLVGLQQEDGAFHYPELWPAFPPEPWEKIPNASAQFALWIARTLARIR